MNPDTWPAPSEGTSREPLPRVEDLPISEQGYEQESVKAAFDSFYRHAAQLDAALRTLEAVDSFHRQAAALRADLRTLRTAGWSQQPLGGAPPPYYGYGTGAPREGVSPAVWRLLGEVVLLVAVSVLLGVAKLPWWVIVCVMGGAFAIIATIEWAASRDRWAPTLAEPVSPHPILEAEPAPPRADESDASGWTAFEEAQEPSDAMTIIGAPLDVPRETDAAPEADAPPELPVAEAEALEPAQPVEATPVAEEQDELHAEPRRRWWRRHGDAESDAFDEGLPQPEAPKHVRILGPDEQPEPSVIDPWEQGFDEPVAANEPVEPDEETGEDAAAVASDDDAGSRRRFRRR